jgi:hypothetical protein
MKNWRKHFGSALFAPLLLLGLLGAIALQNASHLKPKDVESFHERARIAIKGRPVGDDRYEGGIPYSIGRWTGRDEPIPTEAQKLLKPNAIFSRLYVDTSPSGMTMRRSADLLIVQCRDSRDMGGHYPPICYRAHGQELKSKKEKTWVLPGGLYLPGIEYEFERNEGGEVSRRFVYDFMVLPGPNGGIVRDIEGVYKVSEDYQQRYYGAAQFQLVMGGSLSEAERDQIFQELVGANVAVIQTLKTIAVNQ